MNLEIQRGRPWGKGWRWGNRETIQAIAVGLFLAVHENPDGYQLWRITHVQTGLFIGDYPTKAVALRTAKKLATFDVWDLPDFTAAKRQAKRGYPPEVLAVLRKEQV